jgi:hypothetical protein
MASVALRALRGKDSTPYFYWVDYFSAGASAFGSLARASSRTSGRGPRARGPYHRSPRIPGASSVSLGVRPAPFGRCPFGAASAPREREVALRKNRPGEPVIRPVCWIRPGSALVPDNHSYPELMEWRLPGAGETGRVSAGLAGRRLGSPDAGIACLLAPDAIVLPSNRRACSATHGPVRLAAGRVRSSGHDFSP